MVGLPASEIPAVLNVAAARTARRRDVLFLCIILSSLHNNFTIKDDNEHTGAVNSAKDVPVYYERMFTAG